MLGAATPPRLRTSFRSDQSTYDIIWSISMRVHPVRPSNTLCDSLSFLYARRILILVAILPPYRILEIDLLPLTNHYIHFLHSITFLVCALHVWAKEDFRKCDNCHDDSESTPCHTDSVTVTTEKEPSNTVHLWVLDGVSDAFGSSSAPRRGRGQQGTKVSGARRAANHLAPGTDTCSCHCLVHSDSDSEREDPGMR